MNFIPPEIMFPIGQFWLTVVASWLLVGSDGWAGSGDLDNISFVTKLIGF